MRPRFIVAAAFSVVSSAAPLQAQETPAALPPVVVTGLPTARAELAAPAAIGVVNATDLEWGQPQIGLDESLVTVPGINVRDRQNYAQDLQIQSRGYGARSTFGVRGLQLRLDGIPLTAPDGQGQTSGLLISALDRVEVLRGPLAYGYGNASGGVVAAFSAPAPAQAVVSTRYLAGADGTWRGSMSAAGQALGSVLGYRVEAARFITDGYRDHSAAKRDQVAATASFQISPSDRVGLLINTLSQPEAQDALGLTRAQYQANPRQADAAATNFNTRKSLNDRIGGARYTHDTARGGSLDVLAYATARRVEQVQSIPASVQAAPSHSGGVIDLDRDGYGVETHFTQKFSSAVVSAGLQAQTLDEARQGYENFQGSTLGVRGNLRRDEDNTVENFDQFVSAEFQLAPRWALLGALRHSAVQFESEDHYTTANPDDSGSRDYGATTPSAALRFDLDVDDMLYASWGRGFETPTFNELSYRSDGSSGLNFALQDARSETWELGWKRALSQTSLLTLTAFHVDGEREIVPATNSGGRASFQNAKGTRRQGAEASLRYKLPSDLSLALAADYLDAEFTETYSYVAAGTTQTVARGNRIPGIARSNAYLELAWRRGLPGWSAGLDARHSASVPVNDVNSDAAESYRVLNARLVYARPADWGGWSLFASGDNLLDETYAGSVIVNEANSRFFEPAPGRGWFAGVEFDFKPGASR